MADSNLRPWPTYYAYAHKIQRCDATTGHTVKDVAFCDSPERAKEMAEAFIRADLVEQMAAALRLATAQLAHYEPVAPLITSALQAHEAAQ